MHLEIFYFFFALKILKSFLWLTALEMWPKAWWNFCVKMKKIIKAQEGKSRNKSLKQIRSPKEPEFKY
jgi:hypothetical protein